MLKLLFTFILTYGHAGTILQAPDSDLSDDEIKILCGAEFEPEEKICVETRMSTYGLTLGVAQEICTLVGKRRFEGCYNRYRHRECSKKLYEADLKARSEKRRFELKCLGKPSVCRKATVENCKNPEASKFQECYQKFQLNCAIEESFCFRRLCELELVPKQQAKP